MNKILKNVLLIAVLGIAVFIFRTPLSNLFFNLENKFLPCRQVIVYSIGTFDARFGMSKADFLSAVREAEQIWEKPVNKQSFQYSTSTDTSIILTNSLKINLIYDYRQQATAVLNKLGITITDSQNSYDSLKTKYDALKASYLEEKATFDARVSAFDARKSAYESKVTEINNRGGATKEEYANLNAEKIWLQNEAAAINQMQADLNTKVDDVNAMATVLNRLIASLNLQADQFNSINKERAGSTGEFEEGTYISGPSGREIDIYQFDDRNKLVRVLAHELGHAFGLDHVSDPKAIMYRLNNGVNEKLTNADLAELKQRCGIK